MGTGGMGKMNNEEREGRDTASTQAPGSMIDRKEDWIGRQLRRVFDNAVSEPLPDDIMSLLERIDEAGIPASKPDTTTE